MILVKYWTNNRFDRNGFVDMLHKYNVTAHVDGEFIILDRDAVNAIPPMHRPHWLDMNMRFINSDLHCKPIA